jgi:hypothetical protein
MPVTFDIGFGVFLVLMAGLVVFVLRFAIRQGRRRPPAGGDLDEPSSAALVDDPDEGGDP